MIATLGRAGVALGLLSALLLVAQAVRAQRHPERVGRAQLRPAVAGLLLGAMTAMYALELALVRHDFSIAYVANNHARATPLVFTVASAWAALEGSIVLWSLVLAGYVASVYRATGDSDRLTMGALAVMGVVAVFFFGLMATVADPFRTLPVAPADGRGPNPLLQDNLLMAVHPPMLYLGFVGFTVPFAFAISALALGQGGTAWLRVTRRWTLVAWAFLTAGIVLGGWWSYEVLGWGGFWAWDPVENASLLPWLAATAFVHSAVVQIHRGMLRAWNVALVIATFALTILGTFLTRSGVIASVHSFTQSAIGPLLLGFLVIVLVGSFGLFAARVHLVASGPRLESMLSREGLFLVNNLLLALFAFTVLTGTLYPIFVEAFTGAEVSVGRPFFDRMAIPISLTLLVVVGLGPITPYRAARPAVIWVRVRIPVLVAVAGGAALVLAGVRAPYVVLVAMAATAVTGAITRELAVSARRAARGERLPLLAAFGVLRRNPGYWGGQIAHVGVVIVAVAIALAGNLATRGTATLQTGQDASVGPLTLVLRGTFERQEPNRLVSGARVEVQQAGRKVAVLAPRLSLYPNQVQAIGTPAVRTGPTEDIYLSLARLESGRVEVRVYRYPFMWLLWLGGFVTAAGGGWALLAGRRTRRPAETTSLPAPATVSTDA